MVSLQNLLPHYHRICSQEEPPNFILTKKTPVSFSRNDTTQVLWEKHTEALNIANQSEKISNQSLLDLKIELVFRVFSRCQLCEHQCNVDRTKQQGYCMVSTSRIASEFIHKNEESLFIPSHTIFFSGCTFKCIFCQNWDISQFQSGIRIPETELAERIHLRKQQGSRNVNWVGGEPTPNILYILKTLKDLDDPLPQIWNSNMYCSVEALYLLDGIIDVYLSDFKFGNDICALELCKSKAYTSTIQRNIILANKKADLFIRHLVLPSHIYCCSLPILHWIHDTIPLVPLNIMDQFRPCYHARNHPVINRIVTSQEYETVISEANKLDLILV